MLVQHHTLFNYMQDCSFSLDVNLLDLCLGGLDHLHLQHAVVEGHCAFGWIGSRWESDMPDELAIASLHSVPFGIFLLFLLVLLATQGKNVSLISNWMSSLAIPANSAYYTMTTMSVQAKSKVQQISDTNYNNCISYFLHINC